MKRRDAAIVGYAHAKLERNSGRSALGIAGALLDELLEHSGIEKSEIDGLAVVPSLGEAGNPFWSNFVADYLALRVTWLQTTDLGGAAAIGSVARACAAIAAGLCETVVLLGADAPRPEFESTFSGYRLEWEQIQGLPGPPGEFGLLLRRYMYERDFDPAALGAIAIAQRAGALHNPNAAATFAKPLSMDDYLASRVIADPVRLLDCVMPVDGGAALLLTTADRAAKRFGGKSVFPTAYAEVTNPDASAPAPDVLVTGFDTVIPRVYAQAGIGAANVSMFQPYDDFTVAVLMQLEAAQFCAPGKASAFAREADFSARGALPLNTGGGQLSCGQPGLAAGFVNLVEAVIQLFGEAHGRQVPDARNALVTGIGMIPLLRNWGTSNALLLEV